MEMSKIDLEFKKMGCKKVERENYTTYVGQFGGEIVFIHDKKSIALNGINALTMEEMELAYKKMKEFGWKNED